MTLQHWVTYANLVGCYRTANGVPTLDKALGMPNSVSAGAAWFDGTNLWNARAGVVNQIDPRSCHLIGTYPTDSTSGGFTLFDGLSIFAGGNGGSTPAGGAVYRIPRVPPNSN